MLRRSVLRQIKSTLGRYLAIFAIIALGVGFFAGLRVCTDSMRKTADKYLSEKSLYDFRLISTIGLTTEDEEAFSCLPGIERAAGSVTKDFLYISEGSTDLVMRAHMIMEGINCLDLIAGRMPQSGNECLLDAKYFGEDSIGTVLSLSPDNSEETLDGFVFDDYTVVGLTNASYYVNFERGSTSLGNGKVEGFIYVPADGFESDYYTEIFLSMGDRGDIYSDEYKTALNDMEPSVTALLDERADLRFNSLKSEAEQDIADAERELEDGRREYAAERADAEKQLSEAKLELEKARNELDDGYRQLNEGKAELADNRALAEQELYTARNKLDSGWAQYYAGEQELLEKRNVAEKELNSAREQLNDAAKQIEEAGSQIESLMTMYETGKEMNLGIMRATGMVLFRNPSDLMKAIASGSNQTLNSMLNRKMEGSGMTAEEFAATWLQSEEKLGMPVDYDTILTLKSRLKDAQTSYDAGLAEFEKRSSEAEAAFAEAEGKLADSRAQLEAGEEQYYKERDSAYSAIDDAQKQIEESERKLADGEKEYLDGAAEYEKARSEADEKFSDAEQELADAEHAIEDARTEIDDLKVTTYVLDRTSNIGYASLENDMGIVRGISRVFPLFFFLVAALVCITTMTRMVDEQRTQNGVLKALGYGNWAIAGQYLFYAGSASVLGCIAGFLLGSRYMPMALWQVYQIMYSIDRPVAFLLDWKLFFACTALYLVCSLGATYTVCRQDLREAPAELIRPKAPPAGSHILIERVSFIWKRVRFLHKVSIRNILRYKKRMIMMILGVGGCTALLLAGFGVRDSIQDILVFQYGEIEIYDMSVMFMDEMGEQEIDSFSDRYSGIIEGAAFVHLSNMDFTAGGKTVTVNTVSFDEDLDGFIDLHEGKQKILWPEKGEAVIDFRLARECGLSVGDRISIMDPDFRELTLTVSGIFDNYIYDYVFINAESFREQWGEAPAVKTAFINADEGTDVHAVSAELLGDDTVANVNVLDDMRQRVGSMLESMNYIVLIVLVCAGALAFIVLYNLTNISINERRREIATLKVLGFYPRETAAYVFRENMVLTGISALFGLPMGYALLWYVMQQIKISSFYFPCRAAPLSYIMAVALTFVFAAVVALALNIKLENIDMADSLKAVE